MKTRDLVAAFLNSGKARGLSPRTIEWYEIMLRPFSVMYLHLPRKVEAIEEFLGGLSVGDESLHGYYRSLKAFYFWCEKRYGVANPMRAATPPKRRKKLPRTLSSTEIGCLFLVPLSKRDRALVSLLLDTGIRIGEAVGLEVQDVGVDTIMVDGKTGPREVPISPDVSKQVLDIASDRYVFRGYKGHLTAHQGHYIIRKDFLAAGIKGRKLGPHTLRHTFGRHFIMAGGDAFSLQRILGHTDIQTTRIYVELNTQDIIRQHHKFTPIRAALASTPGRLIDEAETIIRTMSREEGQ
jgi:site-specific recombinase XerD